MGIRYTAVKETKTMTTAKRKIGEILVGNGTISEKTLQRALQRAERENRKIGLTLEEMGVATFEEIAEALAEQFKCRVIRNIASYSFSPDLLKMIPIDTATRYLIFPLKKEQNTLCLAIADPTETRIVSNIAKNNDLTVIPFLATRKDIIAAINKHYLGKESSTLDKRKTVLVVEDSPVISSELEALLSKEGYRVLCAKDGIEGFQKAITEVPDVILTDKEMPRFDGYRLLESLRSLPETSRIPVLLHTASLNSNEEAEAFRKGFFDFMAKPVKDITLITRIKRAIQAFEVPR
jgi:CheY-like chemotaxis protein